MTHNDFVKDLNFDDIVGFVDEISERYDLAIWSEDEDVIPLLTANGFKMIGKSEHISEAFVCYEVAENEILLIFPTNQKNKVLTVEKFLRIASDVLPGKDITERGNC